MAYKPMEERDYRRFIKIVGWSLSKAGIDYNLLDDKGNYVCSIKITHGKNTKGGEIIAHCVKKTEKEFKLRRLTWPPRKK